MTRRLASVLAFVGLFLLPASAAPPLVAPAVAQQPVYEITEDDDPRAVVEIDVEERSAELEDAAWTFRFLVPTALILSAVIVALIAGGYGVGVRGRYRVRE